jgi:hypothetical protein
MRAIVSTIGQLKEELKNLQDDTPIPSLLIERTFWAEIKIQVLEMMKRPPNF